MMVVETETFLARAARLAMSATERTALIIYLASNPEAGVIIPETGGVRKLRWALPGSLVRGICGSPIRSNGAGKPGPGTRYRMVRASALFPPKELTLPLPVG